GSAFGKTRMMCRKPLLVSLLGLALLALLAQSPVQVSAQDFERTGPPVARSAADAICQDPQLTTLCRIIDAADDGEGAATLRVRPACVLPYCLWAVAVWNLGRLRRPCTL
ncbi:hypothetical protein Agub_g1914, partial [Astrephomene gubernaculifera]